jgi:hypothetical protein
MGETLTKIAAIALAGVIIGASEVVHVSCLKTT